MQSSDTARPEIDGTTGVGELIEAVNELPPMLDGGGGAPAASPATRPRPSTPTAGAGTEEEVRRRRAGHEADEIHDHELPAVLAQSQMRRRIPISLSFFQFSPFFHYSQIVPLVGRWLTYGFKCRPHQQNTTRYPRQ
jgi:hypothetical protein